MIELLTTAEMAEADRLAMAGGISSLTLMENAGRALADCTAAHAGRDAVVVAGPGNNGGDGFVAARLLTERGFIVRVVLAGELAQLKGDAAAMAKQWTGVVEPAAPQTLAHAEIIIDALFGTGLDRPVEGLARAMIEAMNERRVPVIAADLPSGINGNSGAVMGAAVRATETVTFFRRKPGHLLLPGRLHCGEVHVADIEIPARVLEQIKPRTFINDVELWSRAFPRPRIDGHKYMRGHAVAVSGGIETTGAARLAARGALRGGAGLVTIASPREALAVNAAANLAVMVRAVDGAAELAAFLGDKRRNAVVLGPGGGVGPHMREMVLSALASEAAVVLDADALTSFAEKPSDLAQAIEKRGRRPTILTPHEGEFSSLFSKINGLSNVNSKLEKASLAAKEFGAIVLFKGADSVVAAPDGRAAIAANAPPWLATAGSGDVLAGMIGGLLAQGMPGFETTAAAVWLHGEAANAFGPGLIADDLPEMLPTVYRWLNAQLEGKSGAPA